MWKIASVLALLIVAVLAGWFYLGEEPVYQQVGGSDRTGAEEVAVPPLPLDGGFPDPVLLPAETAAEPLPEDPAWVLPPLNQSDPFVREQLAAMGAPDAWGAPEELVRRLAALIENSARGEYPRRQLGFVALGTPFKVVERDGRQFLDPANYSRYDGLLGALEAVDPRAVARLLDFLVPLIDQALAELGATGTTEPLLGAGLRRILEVPVLTEEPELLRPNVFYVYADPALEGLRPLQKLILRSGPSNVLRVQSYARRLAGAMGVTPAAP